MIDRLRALVARWRCRRHVRLPGHAQVLLTHGFGSRTLLYVGCTCGRSFFDRCDPELREHIDTHLANIWLARQMRRAVAEERG